MEKLLKQKEVIEKELEEAKSELSERQIFVEKMEEKLCLYKHREQELSAKVKILRETLKQKKKNFNILKEKVKEYKLEHESSIRKTYTQKFNDYLQKIKEVKFNFNLQIFSSFDKIKEILDSINGFNNLRIQLDKFIVQKKLFLKETINKSIVETNEIHKIIYVMKILHNYEEYFNENLIDLIISEYINRRYEYHFMSNKDSNRLDKSEWMFDYLFNKISEVYKLLKLYIDLNKRPDKQNLTFYLKDLMKTISLLIKQRIQNLENLESNQKQNIFIDFNYHLHIFIKNVYTKYNIDIKSYFAEFTKNLIQEEENFFICKIQEIHRSDYKEWFKLYESVLREIIDLNKKHLKINIDMVVDTLLEYNQVFIDNMRYIDRKEIQVLIWLFDEFEKFKDFFINGLCDEISSEKDNSFLNNESVIYKISKLNLENYKLIKSLFENDINNILSIKYYFINDVVKILEEYKNCKLFTKLKIYSACIIDKYLLEQILLKYRLDRNEFLDLLGIFSKLKDVYNTKGWRSRESMKCIKGIFENKPIVNEYSEHLSNLYS